MTHTRDRDLLTAHFTAERPLRIQVITLSDRAAQGVYEDKSGPRVVEHLQRHYRDGGPAIALRTALLSDDPAALQDTITAALAQGTCLIVTTGGTGIGPRDHAPDVVLSIAEKTIPGIMEMIRLKYGMDKPAALLSRAVAATVGPALIYTLPGNPKAVDEYMTEIVKTLDHALCISHGLDAHWEPR